jgi:hypothetical protein
LTRLKLERKIPLICASPKGSFFRLEMLPEAIGSVSLPRNDNHTARAFVATTGEASAMMARISP